MSKLEKVGDVINFRGIIYSPVKEQGVIGLFITVLKDLNMRIELMRTGFPDCLAHRYDGYEWVRVNVEFELKSRGFLKHGHNVGECDLIVCWEHDWSDCPIEVIELREYIKELENYVIEKPDKSTNKEAYELVLTPIQQEIYEEIEVYTKTFSDKVWVKTHKNGYNMYSPKRVFVYMSRRKDGFKIYLLTYGEIDNLEYSPLSGRHTETKKEKVWGNILITSLEQLEAYKPSIRLSYDNITKITKE